MKRLEIGWADYGLAACPAILIALLLFDTVRSFKERSHWIPPRAMGANAMVLVLLNNVGWSLANFFAWPIQYHRWDIKNATLLTDTSTLLTIVAMAFMMPSMAKLPYSRLYDFLVALFLVLVVQLSAHFYLLLRIPGKETSLRTWSIVTTSFMAMVLVVLFCALLYSVSAGKSTRVWNRLTSARTPPQPNDPPQQDMPLNDVFLDLFVKLRTSRPDYVVARSTLSSTAGLLVSVIVALFATKWALHNPLSLGNVHYLLYFPMQMAFILVGWLLVCYRSVTAVYYFGGTTHDFIIQDWWISELSERNNFVAKEAGGLLFKRKRERDIFPFLPVIFTLVRLRILMPTIIAVQYVLLECIGKVTWKLSNILFGKILRFSRGLITCKRTSNGEFPTFSDSHEERAKQANSAAKRIIERKTAFSEDNCKDLVSSFTNYILKEENKNVQQGMPRTRSVHKEENINVLESMPKMRSVCLLSILMCTDIHEDRDEMERAFKLCFQSWCVLGIIDTSAETEMQTADNELRRLYGEWSECRDSGKNDWEGFTRQHKERIQARMGALTQTQKGDDMLLMEDLSFYIKRALEFAALEFLKLELGGTDKRLELVGKDKDWQRCLDIALSEGYSNVMALLEKSLFEGITKVSIVDKCYTWASQLREDKFLRAASAIGILNQMEHVIQSEMATLS